MPRVKRFIYKRLLSFSLLIGIGFLLLVSLVISAGLSAVNEYIRGIPILSEIVLQILNLIISLGLITLLFALVFKYVPDVEITWRNVWLGAAITALLFTVGKALIGLYLGSSNVGSAFGAAGIAGPYHGLGLLLFPNPVFGRRIYPGVFQKDQIETTSKRTCKTSA